MRVPRWCIVLAMLCISPMTVAAQTTVTTELQKLLRDARFVFRGTVVKTAAANMAAVPSSPANAVVKVDQAFVMPAQLGDFTGQEITILLLRPGSAKAGDASVYFSYGWIYGSTLAVREVGHMAVPANPVAFREQLADAQRRNGEQDLAQLLARAEVVVAGRLARIEPVTRQEPALPKTEHDPDLRRGFLQAQSVLKGRFPRDGIVSFLFANSRDVAR
jgi:hypothetical protein